MIEVLGSPPMYWTEGYAHLNKLGVYFQPTKKKDLKQNFNRASPIAINLMERMLEYVPEKRITAREILKHPYFQQFKDIFPIRSPIMNRGKSVETSNILKIRNSYIRSSIAEPNKLSTNDPSCNVKKSNILNTDITSKFNSIKNQVHKSVTLDVKPWNPHSLSVKHTPSNYQNNPLKISMTPVISGKIDTKNMTQIRSWQQQLANGHIDYLQASNFQSS